ncbi:MAG TPA: hypothetical protein VNM66_06930 [Thermodesulfobacteriota bacterium]|nr:hypothetical protein [Thermodesulfobacteriota bacterium]
MATVALLGLHLRPPVRELTRDRIAVEARTLARAQRLTLRALPRSPAAGPIGRAALGFAVSAEPGVEPARALARLVAGLARLGPVTAVSFLLGPREAEAAARLPTVEVEPADLDREPAAALFLPDRLYVVSAGEGDGGGPGRRRLGAELRALGPAGEDREAG